MSKINESAAQKIIALLDEKQITQKALAEYLEIQPNTISGWLSGKHKISLENIYKIANYLDVSVDYLLGLQTARTQDKDLAFVCNFLGIDERTVKEIKRLAADERYCHIINDFCIPKKKYKSKFINRKSTSKLHFLLRLIAEEQLERGLQISTAERIIENPRLTAKDVDKIIEEHRLNSEDAERMKKALRITVEDDMKYYALVDEFWDSDDKIRLNTYRIQETIKAFLHEYYKKLIQKTDVLKESIPSKKSLLTSPVDSDNEDQFYDFSNDELDEETEDELDYIDEIYPSDSFDGDSDEKE